MPDPAVVVVGDANVDMVIRLPDRRAQPSDPAHFHPQLHGGGSAANTAVALARLGVHVSFAGALGEWDNLEELVKGLVDTQHLAYFAVMIAGFLVLTKASVESVRWR